MASLQDIRRRIRSVKSIQQITKAMKMVAAARLRRAQMAAVANKPYADKMAEVVENVAANVTDFKHPLLERFGIFRTRKKLILSSSAARPRSFSATGAIISSRNISASANVRRSTLRNKSRRS